jgi:hypothetical protein
MATLGGGTQRQTTFTLACPRCAAQGFFTTTEVRTFKVRSGVYRWHCVQCDHVVEYSPIGAVVKRPVKWKKPTTNKGKIT